VKTRSIHYFSTNQRPFAWKTTTTTTKHSLSLNFSSGGGGGVGRWVVKEGKTIHQE